MLNRYKVKGNGERAPRSELVMGLTWRTAAGKVMSHFAEALKERRILGRRCPSCDIVYLPPRPVCGDCNIHLTDFVEVGPLGTVITETVVHHSITDPVSGKARPVPYVMGLIRLDRASTTLNHYLTSHVAAHGVRVQPVWRDQRTGTMADIAAFEVVQ